MRSREINEDTGPRRRVDCEIPRQLEREQNIIYKSVEIGKGVEIGNLSPADVF